MAGPSGGEPEVGIDRGAVLVRQYGGSRERFDETFPYMLRQDHWELIGFTIDWADTLDPERAHTTQDVNFITGRVNVIRSSRAARKRAQTFLDAGATTP